MHSVAYYIGAAIAEIAGCEIRETSPSLSHGLRRFVDFENTIANAALCLDEFAAMPALSSEPKTLL